jgi:ABC-type phosphate/phosphonate transport system substrate-binding protein
VLAKTAASPGLPFITSSATSADDLARLQSCLAEVFENEENTNVLEWGLPGASSDDSTRFSARLQQAKKTLRIKGIKIWESQEEAHEAYRRVQDMDEEAKASGYPALQ